MFKRLQFLAQKPWGSRRRRLERTSDVENCSSTTPSYSQVNSTTDEQVIQQTVKELLSHANSLRDEFEQGAEARCIEEAIALDREALAMCTPGHPLRDCSLSQLSAHLQDRYEQLGGMEAIEEAILLEREALELRPPGNKDRSTSMCRLALCLVTRHQQLGQAEDLSEAIDLNRKALLLCSPGHPNRLHIMGNLSAGLVDRYQQLGSADDLSEATDFAREHLMLCPPGHPERPISLNNLAIYLYDRYRLLGGLQDLSEATDLLREALKLCPPGHQLQSYSLNNLANCLGSRYWELGALEDISEAIDLYREALKLRPPGHPLRSSSLYNLARCLGDRYQKLGGVEDVSEVIDLYREALRLRPPGHPSRSQCLNALIDILSDRYQRLCKEDDKDEMFSLYNQLSYDTQSISFADISAARAWIREAENFHHFSTTLAYQTALRLLVQYLTALPSLPQHLAMLRKQSASIAIDAFSAFLRNKSPTNAVEVLEQGRSLSWSQLARLRSPLDDVVASGSEGQALADDYTHLTSLIRETLSSASGDQHDRVWHLNVKLAGTVSKIRELPGLSRFLLPSLFPDLRCAASDGPVVIVNASQYSCDALVVSVGSDPIRVLLSATQKDIQLLVSTLGKLTERAKKDEVTKDLQEFLRDLWDQVVSPIAYCLRSTLAHPVQSRIWWCPTAEFSLLPLHAAAPYRKDQKGFSDLYISSYTPTLAALIRARQSTSSTSASTRKHFVAVGQANASGTNKLQSVGTELANLARRFDGLATFTSIEGQDSSISRVTEELEKNEWVHLACHGLPDKSHPLESAFALQDGRLTVQRIGRLELKHAEFAYLSACHTTVGDEESPDESLHLAAAMQFAGFRSVIGTMWAVDDAQTNKITSVFYKLMVDESGRLDHTRAAYALWKTTRWAVGKVPLDQRILYVHLGA